MKITYLAPANSIHSLKWIRFFSDKGHQVSWITLHEKNLEIPSEIKLYEKVTSASNPVQLASAIAYVRQILKEEKPDLVHIHSAGTYGLVGSLALSFGELNQIPVVLTGWGSDIVFGGKHPIKRWFVKHALKKANLVTTDAQHMVEAMAKLGASKEKIRIINFGIDTRRFSRRPAEPAIAQKLGFEGRPTVISLRNFEPVYEVSTLVKAVPLVAKQVPDVLFVLIGRGSEADNLKKLVSDLGVENNVRFPGFFPNNDLPTLLSMMDVYVSTSLSDAGIASSTAEAMACELPVVVTDSGENSLWVESGKNGYLVPVSTPELLAEKILALLRNAGERQRMGQAGRQVVEARNDYYGEMQKMETLYQELR